MSRVLVTGVLRIGDKNLRETEGTRHEERGFVRAPPEKKEKRPDPGDFA